MDRCSKKGDRRVDVSLATDIELAATIASAFLRQNVQAVVPVIGKGSVNQIFIARTTKTEVVIRMSRPEDEARALQFYEKEAWCLKHASVLGIPGPTVLALGCWGTRPYMVQTFVVGVNGEDSSLDKSHIWHALGRYAKIIHSIPVEGFGEMLIDFQQGNAKAGWRRFIDYNLNSLTDNDELLRLRVYTPAQIDAIRQAFYDLRTRPFRFGVNHCDLAIRNTVIDESGKISLLDWGSAEAHIVPHYDLIEILRWHRPNDSSLRAFLTGYGMDKTEFMQLLPELQSLMLLKAFDLTRWAIDRCPAQIHTMAERARQTVQLKFKSM